jgi:flagellar basal-body rod modification protein FlgD
MDFSQISSSGASGLSAAETVGSTLTRRHATPAAAKAATSATSGTASSSGSSSSSAASSSSDITANDFLTLLVSELQNQDPTQPTDPNEYITQLAQVNSLEQLVSINQGIGTLDSAVAPTSSSSSGSSSGSNVSSNAVADVTNVNAALGLQQAQGQNAIWGGSTAG